MINLLKWPHFSTALLFCFIVFIRSVRFLRNKRITPNAWNQIVSCSTTWSFPLIPFAETNQNECIHFCVKCVSLMHRCAFGARTRSHRWNKIQLLPMPCPCAVAIESRCLVRVFHRKIQQRIHCTHTHMHTNISSPRQWRRFMWVNVPFEGKCNMITWHNMPRMVVERRAAGWIVPIAKSTTFFVSGNLWLLDWQTVRICTAQRWPAACENSLLEGVWLNQSSAVWDRIYFGVRIDPRCLEINSHFDEATYLVLKGLTIKVVTVKFWL